MKIKFKVKGQKLIRKNKEEVASFVRNHLKCSFCFDENWIDLEKYAIFTDINDNQTVVRLGFGQKLCCAVPPEVTQGNYFRVSVFANELLTSTQERVLLSPSGYTSNIDNIDMDESGDIITSDDINSNNDDEDKYDCCRRCYDDEYYRVPYCKQFIRDEHPFDD